MSSANSVLRESQGTQDIKLRSSHPDGHDIHERHRLSVGFDSLGGEQEPHRLFVVEIAFGLDAIGFVKVADDLDVIGVARQHGVADDSASVRIGDLIAPFVLGILSVFEMIGGHWARRSSRHSMRYRRVTGVSLSAPATPASACSAMRSNSKPSRQSSATKSETSRLLAKP
jgi:hypothetical protein